jgi:hypothetical protein
MAYDCDFIIVVVENQDGTPDTGILECEPCEGKWDRWYNLPYKKLAYLGGGWISVDSDANVVELHNIDDEVESWSSATAPPDRDLVIKLLKERYKGYEVRDCT